MNALSDRAFLLGIFGVRSPARRPALSSDCLPDHSIVFVEVLKAVEAY
jgi:hypothetical protein